MKRSFLKSYTLIKEITEITETRNNTEFIRNTGRFCLKYN